MGGAAVLAGVGIALPFAAGPVTGDPGATVGAVVLALLLLAVATAIWPAGWTPAEVEHHRLDSIWRELRGDADRDLPWERHAAWAEPADDSVVIGLVCRVPTTRRVAGAPSPYRWEERRRLDADEVDAAAEAMESLREEAAEREAAAERRWKQAQAESERRAHERRLADIDREAQATAKARDDAMRRETAEQEAADRRAQAEAVAQALRRP